jgi:threonyl-tRNA synthetase
MYITKIDDREFAVKPMNCPGGMLVYKENMHSYKELPLRIGELGHVHRHELSGVLNGLFRVRTFTQDDAHIFCTEEQLESEIIDIMKLIKEMYAAFGFKKYKFTLSVRSEKKKDKYMGTDEQWKWAEQAILKALNKQKVKAEIMEGEAKFYGPSLDVQIEDALGREWQCSTVQLDFNLPSRFDIAYEGKDGKKHTPYVLHRVIYGSLERFLGILIENYAGKFPLWLSPTQVKIITVSDKNTPFAKEVEKLLKSSDIRAELDEKAESIGKKVREAEIHDKPYYIVTIGDKEVQNKSLAVRSRDGKLKFGVKPEDFLNQLKEEIKAKC